MMTLVELEKEVKQLPRDQQITLISDILTTEPSDTEMQWYKEAARRREELLTGKVKGIPLKQVLSEIRTELHR